MKTKRLALLLLLLFLQLHSFSQTTYIFNGNGEWTVPANWNNSILPPAVLPPGDTIYISPPGGSACILNTAQIISKGAGLIISANVVFIISGGVVINNNYTALPNITICKQVWTQRNLDVVTYRNGDTIPEVTDSATWVNLTTGAWCYYNNDPSMNAVYGKLYNRYALEDVRGLAPAGWHIAAANEWDSLNVCLEPDPGCLVDESYCATVSAYLKEADTVHWMSPNRGGSTVSNPEIIVTNSSGFTALPGGCRMDGAFIDIRRLGYWWTSTKVDEEYPVYKYSYVRQLHHAQGQLQKRWYYQNNGFSVRCVRDAAPE
ncbi:MAG: fibrobacter succinogenes major paralogous domain-containing protein [Ferruginibacter sp.]